MTKPDKILFITITIFVLALSSLFFILPQKDFSDSENRYLSKAPIFNIKSLLSGEYTKGISNFCTDQFPLRKMATSLYALSERTLGKKIIGNTVCYNDHLISIQKNEISKQNIPFSAVIIDSKHTLFKNQSNKLSLYYKTDHHRTTYGAYLIYLEVCEIFNLNPYPEEYFKKEIISTSFYGTSFFASQLPFFAVEPDKIELWRYNNDSDIKVIVEEKSDVVLPLYDFTKLSTSDKYAVFLGGNYAHAKVYSDNDKPTLLLFKDSFANAAVPFLALHFNIELIDPRYSTKMQLSTIYHNKEYDYCLFIGCLESFQ